MEACCGRGRVTTPARRVTLDSSCEAAATSALGSSREHRAGAAVRRSRDVVDSSGPRLEQRVDEEAIALVGGHAARGGVRRADEPELLEVGHDVADGGRRQRQAGLARQRARADRLAVADVAADQHLQQVLFALGDCSSGCLVVTTSGNLPSAIRPSRNSSRPAFRKFSCESVHWPPVCPCYKAAWLYRRKLAR